MMTSRRRPGARGFTLSELLLVLTIALLITLVAYPAMQTFMGGNKDASAATRLTRTFNRVVDQARRTNRAHVVELSLFLANEPSGRMDVYESRSSSCIETAQRFDDDNEVRAIDAMPFGGTVIEEYQGSVEDTAGLRGWTTDLDDEQRETLRLCITPDGSTWRLLGDGAESFGDTLEVRVQRFQNEGGRWATLGPPRRVEVTWGGGARMRVN